MTHIKRLENEDEFLTEINENLDRGIVAYRTDRAANPDLSDAAFLRMFGTEVVRQLRLGNLDADELGYKFASALYRLANIAAELDGLAVLAETEGAVWDGSDTYAVGEAAKFVRGFAVRTTPRPPSGGGDEVQP